MAKRAGLRLLVLLTGACGGNDATTTTLGETGTTAASWTADAPPSEVASGLTIGHIPSGFTFAWNEGHETATFHVFTSADDSAQFAVGRQISPEPYPIAGREVTRGGRVFTVLEGETRILEEVGSGIRIEVVSRSLDAETLLQIAESVHYDPTRDR